MRPRGEARALYLELAARGVCLSTRRVPASMPEAVAKSLWERVRANGAGLREVLRDPRDPDLLAVRQEAGKGAEWSIGREAGQADRGNTTGGVA